MIGSIVRNCVESSVDGENSMYIILDREVDITKISRCIRKPKTGESDWSGMQID